MEPGYQFHSGFAQPTLPQPARERLHETFSAVLLLDRHTLYISQILLVDREKRCFDTSRNLSYLFQLLVISIYAKIQIYAEYLVASAGGM